MTAVRRTAARRTASRRTAARKSVAITGIEIHMEGGGDHAAQRKRLKEGLRVLFKPLQNLAEANGLSWRIFLHGPRDAAYDAFAKASQDPGKIAVLLVDAEGPVSGPVRTHLERRDKWSMGFAPESRLYLMVQVMETWLVADRNAVKGYFGRGLKEKRLPKHADLEAVSKRDIERALIGATEGTQKGRYHKIRHPAGIMSRIDREVLKQRCPSFLRAFSGIAALIEDAGRGASDDMVREAFMEYFGEPVEDWVVPLRHDEPVAWPGFSDHVAGDGIDPAAARMSAAGERQPDRPPAPMAIGARDPRTRKSAAAERGAARISVSRSPPGSADRSGTRRSRAGCFRFLGRRGAAGSARVPWLRSVDFGYAGHGGPPVRRRRRVLR